VISPPWWCGPSGIRGWPSARAGPPTKPDELARWNAVKDLLGYKARPLDGIWATAPYLHNGSVPTLYHLLLPPAERPKSFWLGSRDYDAEKVGYVWESKPASGRAWEFVAVGADGKAWMAMAIRAMITVCPA
jgi:hypothetical protein